MIGSALTQRRTTGQAWTPGFNRYAIAHALSGAGDALVTVSLAGSLFFNISPEASQQQVLIYLLVTMAPFAVLAPLIGPAIDRFHGGDRWVAAALFALRGVFAIALMFTLFDLAFYFFALCVLVASKASGVTKQALMPGFVEGPSELVAANARLARLSTVVGGIGGAVGAVLVAWTSPIVTLGLACGTFVVAAFLAATLPPARSPHAGLSTEVVEQVEYRTLHTGVLVSTSWAFTVMRVAVGFFVFGTAFAFRRASEPPWIYGAAVVGYAAGVFLGNAIAPLLKARYREDRLIIGSIIALAVVAGFGALGQSRLLVVAFAVVLGTAIGVGRQAFDALAQTRAPFAARARAFARFETWFQLGWVTGAILATAIGIPIRYSLAALAVAMVATAGFYHRAIGAARRATGDLPFDSVEVARRRLGYAAEWRLLDRPRFAVTELVSAVDLVRAGGTTVDPQLVGCLERLRSAAIDGRPIENDTLVWAMAKVRTVVADLETAGEPANDRPARPPASDDCPQPLRADRPTSGTAGCDPTAQPPATSDEDVTVNSDSESASVSTSRDQSSAER